MTTLTDRGVSTPPAADWQEQAACRGMDTAIWYPHPGGARGVNGPRPRAGATPSAWGSLPEQLTYPIRICASCPVRRRCLDEALDTARVDRRGIWGGVYFGDQGSYIDPLDLMDGALARLDARRSGQTPPFVRAVLDLQDRTAEAATAALGLKPATVAARLYRAGRADLARRFSALADRQRA